MANWRLRDVNAGTIDDRLLDVPQCTLAYNRFAQKARVLLEDSTGVVPGEYPTGTPLELDVVRSDDGYGNSFGDSYGSGWSTRFGGFVNGFDGDPSTTELELLSHDAWLRRREVYRSYSSVAKSDILADLVGDLTPLTIDTGRIDVFDDDPISAEWSGVPLDKVVSEIASASNDEIFGATKDMVFFFEQRDVEQATRDFTAGEYYGSNFSSDGDVELNEVTVYYGGDPADSAVVVEDRQSQRDLAEQLDAGTGVVISDSKTFTEIIDEAVAERKGEEILNGATEITTGELSTWEGFDIQPGQLTRVVAPDHDVDDEFRVAEITHSWLTDETRVVLAENSEGVIDTLVELSDEVGRVDARAASNNATITRMTDLAVDFEFVFELEAYKQTVPSDALIFGETKGGFGDERVGGGRLGDQRGDRQQVI